MMDADILVVGAGMAGASVAFHLAADRRVVVLEAEAHAGYHTTGRSAALYSSTYGNPVIRALTRASRPLFDAAPGTLTPGPVLSPRGVLYIARADQTEALATFAAETGGVLRRLDGDQARLRTPILSPSIVAALEEDGAADIDVDALHQGYLAGFKARGGHLAIDARVTALDRGGDGWRATTLAGVFRAPVIIDAAGAWADAVAVLAGLAPVGLQPMRRCAALVDAPEGLDPRRWAFTVDVEERFYFGPSSGRLLVSGAEETPVPPCDVQADEMEVAIAVDRVEAATSLRVRHLRRRWAGLRTFAPDRIPVVGFDPAAEGFFWLAGQGGYGIQTAPALSLLAAALVRREGAPGAITAEGVDPAALAPGRPLR